MAIRDLTGCKFGRLQPLSGYYVSDKRVTYWTCRCDCGTIKDIAQTTLVNKPNPSCGCRNLEVLRARSKTHGMSGTPTYNVWCSMIARCGRANADPLGIYFARGISVCARWRNSFEAFLEDMGERPGPSYSIERKDNDGNYEPSNCEWATKTTQARNRRSSKFYTHDGLTLTLPEWAERCGIAMRTLWARVHNGVPFSVAISAPVKSGPKKLPRSA